MLKYIDRKCRADAGLAHRMHVSLLSTAKMERLNILLAKSKMLVQSAGGQLPERGIHNDDDNFVGYVWRSHYLAHGWIPK